MDGGGHDVVGAVLLNSGIRNVRAGAHIHIKGLVVIGWRCGSPVWVNQSRRLGENGSLGCDHGHGGIAFFAGAPVNGGLYGTPPDLSQATTPYNKYFIPFDTLSMDFRRMYAEVITSWFNIPNHASILGGTFPLIGAL